MYIPINRHLAIQLGSFVILLLLASCSQRPASATKTLTDTLKVAAAPVPVDTASNEVSGSEADSESAPYYIIEVASGYDFDSLKRISSNAATILRSKFSMLNRIYKPGKGIIVPDNSDDETYRGEYYPRRPFNENNLVSIEMLNGFYDPYSDSLKMVAVAGMYPLESEADSVAALLKDKIPTTKITRRELYMGCMH